MDLMYKVPLTPEENARVEKIATGYVANMPQLTFEEAKVLAVDVIRMQKLWEQDAKYLHMQEDIKKLETIY